MARRNPTQPDVLTAQQHAAVLVLAGCGTVEEAAAAAGVSRQAVSAWRALPAFAAAVDAEIEAALASARKSLRAAAPKAVSALLSIAGNEDAPESARVQAAKEILNRVGLVEATEVRHAGHDGGALPAGVDERTVAAFRAALSLSGDERAKARWASS